MSTLCQQFADCFHIVVHLLHCRSSSALCQLYGTKATLEHHHFNHAIMILNSEVSSGRGWPCWRTCPGLYGKTNGAGSFVCQYCCMVSSNSHELAERKKNGKAASCWASGSVSRPASNYSNNRETIFSLCFFASFSFRFISLPSSEIDFPAFCQCSSSSEKKTLNFHCCTFFEYFVNLLGLLFLNVFS